jgi:hypothetical protein
LELAETSSPAKAENSKVNICPNPTKPANSTTKTTRDCFLIIEGIDQLIFKKAINII